jgi:hypothetical protein
MSLQRSIGGLDVGEIKASPGYSLFYVVVSAVTHK